MYVAGLNVAYMPHTLDLQGRLRLLPLACISTIHGGHVGNADYTGAIICLTQTPDIKNLRINLKYAEKLQKQNDAIIQCIEKIIHMLKNQGVNKSKKQQIELSATI